MLKYLVERRGYSFLAWCSDEGFSYFIVNILPRSKVRLVEDIAVHISVCNGFIHVD